MLYNRGVIRKWSLCCDAGRRATSMESYRKAGQQVTCGGGPGGQLKQVAASYLHMDLCAGPLV